MKFFTIFITFSLSFSILAKPKNLVLLIVDGMGPASITAARIYAHGSKGKLNLEKFPYTGYAKTYSSNDFVTDSAAAATALATGVKTYNGSIGKSDPKITKEAHDLPTFFARAKKLGKITAAITNTTVTHATPAAFYAHVFDRSMYFDIAKQHYDSSIDLLMGGGQLHFKDLMNRYQNEKWKVLKNSKDLKQSINLKKKRVLGLFAEEHLPYALEDNKKVPTLLELVKAAIPWLQQSGDFFLMLESGKVDHAAHGNFGEALLAEMKLTDDIIGYLLETLDLKNTLFIVTADHETGGVTLNYHYDVDKMKGNLLSDSKRDKAYLSFSTGPGKGQRDKKSNFWQVPAQYPLNMASHTAVDVPVLAIGVGAELFSGYQENTDIPKKIQQIFFEP